MSGLSRVLPRLRLPALPAAPVLRRRLIAAGLIAVALCAAYLFWLRDSALVAVEEVTVSGAKGHPELEAALVDAAREQTTLHVDTAALEEAVDADPAVRGVSAAADFPHGLAVTVDLREPVGYLRSERVAVAADGVVLEEGAGAAGQLPVLDLEGGDLLRGGRVEGNALALAKVLGAAPEPLLSGVDSATVESERGVVVELDAGIELRFGTKGDAGTKWKAAAAVLADAKLESAAYIDLSVPERPVVGGPEATSTTG
jgi:cell division septal protein FtsQ